MVKIMMLMVSSQMMFSKNQMTMIISVMASCVMVSIIIFLASTFHWFSLFVMLIYISGIMVLFMFIVSLAPNEKTLMKTQKPWAYLILLTMVIMLFKNMSWMENLATNSIFSWSILMMTLITILVMIMAYVPPKILMSFYKGMKTSK